MNASSFFPIDNKYFALITNIDDFISLYPLIVLFVSNFDSELNLNSPNSN